MTFSRTSDGAFAALSAGLLITAALNGAIWLYFVPLALLTARIATVSPSQDRAATPRKANPFAIAGAAALLACCLGLAPDLSDDYHRYLWEGYAQNQGYSPYARSPASLYDSLDHPSEGKVNHPEYTAIYPPLAQWLFRLSDAIAPNVYAWKFILALALAPLLTGPSRGERAALLLSPIVLFEGFWNAHLDLLGLVPGFALAAALTRGQPVRAGLALAVMTALKIMPLALAPFCFLHFARANRAAFAAALTLPLLVIYAPFYGQLPQVFDSFLAFSGNWRFNNALFNLLTMAISDQAARTVLAASLALAYAALLSIRADPLWKCAAAWAAIVIFSPTVYPWYLLWLTPLVSGRGRVYLHGAYAASFLSYLVLIPYRADGEWRESWFWTAPEWIGLLYCFYRMLKSEWRDVGDPRADPG